MEKEIWKDINLEPFGGLDYTGYYQVSNMGRVRSLDREVQYINGRNIKYEGRILSTRLSAGYPAITLSIGNIKKTIRIHRLVALVFIKKPDEWDMIEETHHHGYTVNHIDGDKTNNDIDNLEWMTIEENNRHAYKNGLAKSDHLQSYIEDNKKKIKIYNDDTGEELIFESAASAGRYFKVDRSVISTIARKSGNTYRGYKAEYID